MPWGLPGVTSGHLPLSSLLLPADIPSGRRQRPGKRKAISYVPAPPPTPVLGLNIVSQCGCRASSTEGEKLAGTCGFPAEHRRLHRGGHENLKQDPLGFSVSYSEI